jgi:hypothetical protein
MIPLFGAYALFLPLHTLYHALNRFSTDFNSFFDFDKKVNAICLFIQKKFKKGLTKS